ncbi:hypothetical protein EVAR_81115_1 [Eumeta japonica]|uniref:Nucleic-acid-binding protein from transposon X-element n=1 Tax=Eumeta variegata TaxID=151549 RepID=A0A4C1YV60_EUMVA|nr:hypothetical protein EVAR_81115_1 [Eumeta japonica]
MWLSDAVISCIQRAVLIGTKYSSVRSPAPNGRYRVPAPNALTKLFAFCADRPARSALPIESPLRRRPPRSTTNNNLLFQGTANPDGPGTTSLGGCSSPIPGVARPPSIIPHSILRTPFARSIEDLALAASLPWTKIPLLPGAGGLVPKLHHVRIHTTGPNQSAVRNRIRSTTGRSKKTNRESDSRLEPRLEPRKSPMKTNKNKNKRQASSSSDEGATCSDSTVVGSDSESENSNISFTLVEGKNKRALRKALKKAKTQTTSTAPVESTRNPVSASTQAVTAKTAPRTGAKPTAPPRPKLPPPIFLRKGANFLQISADCTRLRINYSKAVRTADDGIKIHCPNVETFRSLNKYLVEFKVQFHTYALEEERKLKAVIRSNPTDFPVDEIQADLCGQGFPVHSVHRLCRRDGSPLWLVLAVLPRTEEAKNIFNNLNMVCASRANPNRPKSARSSPRDLNNFPDLAKQTNPGCRLSPASNPWVNQSHAATKGSGTVGEAVRREPPVSLPASATAGTSSFGDDIQTVMSILRAVKSSEISEFARDFRACSNVEEKLMVLVRYHHLMVKLESI